MLIDAILSTTQPYYYYYYIQTNKLDTCPTRIRGICRVKIQEMRFLKIMTKLFEFCGLELFFLSTDLSLCPKFRAETHSHDSDLVWGNILQT
jgi:hypothetical protein